MYWSTKQAASLTGPEEAVFNSRGKGNASKARQPNNCSVLNRECYKNYIDLRSEQTELYRIHNNKNFT